MKKNFLTMQLKFIIVCFTFGGCSPLHRLDSYTGMVVATSNSVVLYNYSERASSPKNAYAASARILNGAREDRILSWEPIVKGDTLWINQGRVRGKNPVKN